jgi:hypothetical protein
VGAAGYLVADCNAADDFVGCGLSCVLLTCSILCGFQGVTLAGGHLGFEEMSLSELCDDILVDDATVHVILVLNS